MRWTKIKINGFGIHNNLELSLESGLNIVIGRNGSGKTTLWYFLRGLLFGYSKPESKRRVIDSKVKYYKPWTNGIFSGYGELQLDYDNFRLFHNISNKQTSIVDIRRGIDITQELVDEGGYINPGKYLLLMDHLTFNMLSFYDESTWLSDIEMAEFFHGLIPLEMHSPTIDRLNSAISAIESKKRELGSERAYTSLLGSLVDRKSRLELKLQDYVKLTNEDRLLSEEENNLLKRKQSESLLYSVREDIMGEYIPDEKDYAFGTKLLEPVKKPWVATIATIILGFIGNIVFTITMKFAIIFTIVAAIIIILWYGYYKTNKIKSKIWYEKFGKYGIENEVDLEEAFSHNAFAEEERNSHKQNLFIENGRLEEKRLHWEKRNYEQEQIIQEINQLDEEIRETKNKISVYSKAIEVLKDFRDEDSRLLKPIWLMEISKIFKNISGVNIERVVEVSGKIRIVMIDGTQISTYELSFGQQKLFAIAYRFALCKALEGDIKLPWILDEPFAHIDDINCSALANFLKIESTERQIIILSCHEHELKYFDETISIHKLANGG